MKTLDVRAELQSLLETESSLPSIVASLRRLKENGAERSGVFEALASLRTQAADEDVDDRILEIMDFVSGFCSPPMAVWE